MPWNIDIDSHLYCIQHHLITNLTKEFPLNPGKQRPNWMKTDTVAAIRSKAQVFRTLLEVRTAGDFEAEDEAKELLKAKANKVRSLVRRDKREMVEENVDKAMYEYDEGDVKAAFSTLKATKPYKPRPQPVVKNSRGETMLTPEQVEEAWLEHWGILLDGVQCSLEEIFMVKPTDEDYMHGEYIDVTDILPTSCQLATGIKKAKAGKQHGGDCVSIDILKAAPTAAAEALHPVACKAICLRRWPTSWRGDIHIAIPKGGGEHRGIALGDNMCKVVNQHIRSLVIEDISGEAPADTYGSLPGRGTDMAIHMKHELVMLQEGSGCPHAVICFDLVSAFDKVDRKELFAVRPHRPVSAMLRAIHSETWVATPCSDSVVATKSGVKQGDPVADAGSLMIFTEIVHSIRAKIKAAGLDKEIYLSKGAITLPEDSTPIEYVDTAEVAYVDDLAIFLEANTCEGLLENRRWTTTMVETEVSRGGFELNMSKGKTEAVVTLKSKGKLKVLRRLQEDDNMLEVGDKRLGIVPTYVHLGIPHSGIAQMAKVVSRAIDKINQKEKEYMAIIKSKRTSNAMKRRTINIIMSAALCAIHVMPDMGSQQMRRLESRYHSLMRNIFKSKYNKQEETHLDNAMVRLVHGLPSLQCVIRLRRLRYLMRFLTRTPTSLSCHTDECDERRELGCDDQKRHGMGVGAQRAHERYAEARGC
eukprot:TRINITY_DN44409_c0_g2_i1.p1 TRINITY_DN44409_c0_g2~~TRINITY_DN44409_c0_g2_i1.p1  ORF type:complete len:700 (+),score=148.94 TRINITY_DN44409_c0_g2_i1:1-2100(+)